jgi:hypothetical protein
MQPRTVCAGQLIDGEVVARAEPSNCRRRARFSRTRSSRERKVLTNQPRKCRSETIMARILAEKSESSFSQVIHFAGDTTFWRGTGVRSTGVPTATAKSLLLRSFGRGRVTRARGISKDGPSRHHCGAVPELKRSCPPTVFVSPVNNQKHGSALN